MLLIFCILGSHLLIPKLSAPDFEKLNFFLFKVLNIINVFKIRNPSGLPVLLHLLCHRAFRIADYSGKLFFTDLQQIQQSLNLGKNK